MGFGFRIYFIGEDDNITRIPLTRFERIRNTKEARFEYKDSRIRYAEVILALENRKPVSIARIVYGYLKFDAEGKVDEEFLSTEEQVLGDVRAKRAQAPSSLCFFLQPADACQPSL